MAEAVVELRPGRRSLFRSKAPPADRSNIRGTGWWLLVLSLTGQIASFFGSLVLSDPAMAAACFWMFAPTALLGLAMWLTGVIEDRLIQIVALLEARDA